MSVVRSFVPFFRSQWAERFIDTCVVVRITGSSFNETTGQTEPTTSEVYSGECLLRPASASESDFGEARRQEVDYDLYLPHDAADLDAGDRVTVTSALDPDIPVLTVLQGFSDSYLTRQHYECETRDD